MAQAPPTDSSSPLRAYETHALTEEQITSSFPSCNNHFYSSLIMELLQHFEVCSKVRGNPTLYHFPNLFNNNSVTTNDIWSKGHTSFPTHIGRRLLIIDETEYFPPGLFLRLQALLVTLTTPTQSVHFNERSVVIDSPQFQVCVKISLDELSIDLIGRISNNEDDHFQQASNCLQLIDQIQGQIVKVTRGVCPSVFLQWAFLSAKELAADFKNGENISKTNQHVFVSSEIVEGFKSKTNLWNESLKCSESVQELLFFNCPLLMETYTGRGAYLILIHDEIFEKLEDLLNDEDEEIPVSGNHTP